VAGSIILAGVLLKLGGYGLIRVLSLLKVRGGYSRILVALGLVGGAFTRLLCLLQADIKSLVAYSSIGHIGIALGGIIRMTGLGVIRAFVMLVAHGLCSSGLFRIVNIIYEKTGRRAFLISKGLIITAPSIVL